MSARAGMGVLALAAAAWSLLRGEDRTAATYVPTAEEGYAMRQGYLSKPDLYQLAAATIGANGFAVDPATAATIAWLESRGNPAARREEPGYTGDEATPTRVSVGLMQTLISTARDMWQRGHQLYPYPDAAVLSDPGAGMYFGVAYLHTLAVSYGLAGEALVRAYNGGPGYARSDKGRTMTAVYWEKFTKERPNVVAV